MNQILALQELTVEVDAEQEGAFWPPCFSIHESLWTNPTTTTM
ncbi:MULTISPECIES: hypothetical protein [Streptomyces]|nr:MULTISPECIES: hypothetical protein [Streptomyces]MCZ4098557.1 hypothetical protein [Streptomyces sp. H39-C1]